MLSFLEISYESLIELFLRRIYPALAGSCTFCSLRNFLHLTHEYPGSKILLSLFVVHFCLDIVYLYRMAHLYTGYVGLFSDSFT